MNAPHRRLLIGTLLTLLVAAGCSSPTEPEETLTPDFILEDLSGEPFQLSDEQGNVVVLHFFAPWCGICQSEAPMMNELYAQFEDENVTIIGVAVQAESREEIEAFANTFSVPYRVLVDDVLVSTAYNVQTVPVNYFIGRDGRIDSRYNGALPKSSFETIIEGLLAANP